jgi:hypothetical protein
MAFNLVRTAGALASQPFAKARAATIRAAPIAVAARAARHGRGHLTLHLPMAPRTRMAQPLGSRLRPARCSVLTSPDPVRTPCARNGSQPPAPKPRTQDKPKKRQRQDTRARKAPDNESSPQAQLRIQPVH